MVPILVTIDTEGHRGDDPIKKLIFGKTKDGYFGIEKIMDEFETVDAKILFFVDFAEAWDYGKDKVKKIVDTIISRGHDIGVHIHPDHMADKNRLFLWEYSYDEQFDIIRKCTDLYFELVGKRPLSFRAGKYGANTDTLDILEKLGYKYDFSEFYGQQWCKIDPYITINSPVRYGNMREFPVTMHQSVHIGRLVREDKLDIEGMTPKELKYAVEQVKQQDFPIVITLFFHSFSLLTWKDNPDNPVLNELKLNKLRKAISFIKGDPDIKLIRESELDEVRVADSVVARKSIIKWESNLFGIRCTYQKAKNIYKFNKKAKLLVYLVRFMMVAVVICLLIILWSIFLR